MRGCEASPPGFDPQSDAARHRRRAHRHLGRRTLLLALGAPKQEILADRLVGEHDGIGFLCIGAALDFIAGTQVARAPRDAARRASNGAGGSAHNPLRLGMRYWRCARLYARALLKSGPPLGSGLAWRKALAR